MHASGSAERRMDAHGGRRTASFGEDVAHPADDRGREWRLQEHSSLNECMRGWTIAVLVGDVVGIILSFVVMGGGFGSHVASHRH